MQPIVQEGKKWSSVYEGDLKKDLRALGCPHNRNRVHAKVVNMAV